MECYKVAEDALEGLLKIIIKTSQAETATNQQNVIKMEEICKLVKEDIKDDIKEDKKLLRDEIFKEIEQKLKNL